ncbi:fimbrial biogenesis outer membrane usher protein [Salmonella enterica subsp. enterica serovar Hvittingfoss]|nr:fimbrial biogenesis outer membrane usher protein [Salmonella enterica subsp. enterica serovar Hvittingfoss]
MKKEYLFFMVLLLGSEVLISNEAFARRYEFDPQLIGDEKGKSNADVNILNEGGQLPGYYFAKIIINGNLVAKRTVDFTAMGQNLLPCFKKTDLTSLGIDVSFFQKKNKDTECVDFQNVDNVKVNYDSNTQRLEFFLPDKMLLSQDSDIAPQTLWDDGVPAILMGYDGYIQNSQHHGLYPNKYTSRYLHLTPGMNIGAWRLRNSSSWYKNGNLKGKYQSLYTYLEKGISSIHSRLTLGESYSSGAIFDSFPFRGVKVETDDSMMPYEQRAFSPVVRGIARTQARIEVRKNGYLIYSSIVPAGKFELTNLPSTGSSGELNVSVFESDGSVQHFSVPFTAPAVALREGYFNYSIASGMYNPSLAGVKSRSFVSAEAMYGLPWNITAYGGIQGGQNYQATNIGSGLMLGGFGAVSLDTSVSRTRNQNYQHNDYGTRFRLRYNNYLGSGLSFLFSGEEYASKGFRTLTETFTTWGQENDKFHKDFYKQGSLRNQLSINFNQSFNEFGNITLSGSRRDYWKSNKSTVNYSVGYSKNILNDSTLNLNWSKNNFFDITNHKRSDYIASLWLSVPFGHNLYSSYQMISQAKGKSEQELGLNGDAADRQFYWDFREKYKHEIKNAQSTSSLRLTYRGTYGEIGGNYTYNKKLRQMGLNTQGNILLTKDGGLVFSQKQGDTLALVSMPGVSGAKVGYWAGVKTDLRGYTTTGYLQPYKNNKIYINPLSLPSDVSLFETETNVVPTKGAVVLANFKGRVGGKTLVYIKLPDGRPAPFGSIVTMNGDSHESSIVGEGGSVYLTGVPYKKISTISVRWGRDKNQQCKAKFSIPEHKTVSGIYKINTLCSGFPA